MYGKGFGRAAPINVGDEFDVKIESVGEKGDGIAKVQGFVVFVPGVKKGDEVKIKVTRVSQRFAFGEVVGSGKVKKAKPSEEGEESEEESEEEEGTEEKEEEDEEDYEEGKKYKESKEEKTEEDEEEYTDTEDFGEE